MKEVKTPSAIPFYGLAAAVLLYNLILPMYRLHHLLICAAFAAAVYAVLCRCFPPTVTKVKIPEPEPDTGNAALDEAIRYGRTAAAELRALNDAIPDAALSASLDAIVRDMQAILRQVEQQPDKLPKIRKMLSYYLPTTLKLVRKYAQLQHEAGIPAVEEICREIVGSVAAVETAMQKQLAGLYEHDVIDITADIQVMEQMLRAHGLTDEAAFDLEKE
ncbi:MAG: 5-bromo-4-chloroindolyl phosphate hydrolysis family protein [Oscillospiraceae bacterium]|nr:5-bromo-4-chloroindolyl phosphate hydrolysis family protein [Oscillospiraceae bacterium]